MKKYRMHVLCHTHWDREWYQPFQEFRMRLVKQTEDMLDILEEQPDLCFHFDGSAVWADDFLEIMPGEEERLKRLAGEGRILMGPWYCMPDELLLSGESLARNLEKGAAVCKLLGAEPMPVGYVTDVFGHVSQLPQIMKGFGIDTMFLHRGTGCATDEKQEMLWEGADGTKALLIKVFPDTGYQDFLTYRNAPDSELLKYEQRKKETCLTGVLFALDGNDHTPCRRDLKQATERFNGVFRDIHCFPSDMLSFLREEKEALAQTDPAELKLFKGELRHASERGAWNELFNGTASARPYLKQRNDKCEYLLARVCEPLALFARLYGNGVNGAFLQKAWKYLLQNHPHDSIVGCSRDQVHRDMIYRFDQSEIIADALTWESVCALPINTAALKGDRTVTVFNPGVLPTGPVTRFEFDVPMEQADRDAAEGFEPALFDENGEEIEFDAEKTEKGVWAKPVMLKTADAYGTQSDVWVERYRYSAAARLSVPPLGYKTLSVGRRRKAEAETAEPPCPGFLENQYIRFGCEGGKGLFLYDKKRKISYGDICFLEDCGDAGTGWDHVYPERDKRIIADLSALQPEIRTEASGLSQTLTLRFSLRIPKGLDGTARSAETAEMPVAMRFTLDDGCPYVKAKVTVENTAENHRLRILLPTGCGAKTYFADTAFDMAERETRLPDATGWKEQPMPWGPFKNVFGIASGGRGLAVMTKGLCEGGVAEKSGGTLALTLFRSFSETLYGCSTRDSLLLGTVESEFAVMPIDENVTAAALLQTAEAYKLPVYALTSKPAEGSLPPSGSLARIEGEAALSCLRERDGGAELRLFAPGKEKTEVRVTLPKKIKRAVITDMAGNWKKELQPDGDSLRLVLKGKEIVTVFCLFE
ncbi:MAG: hypothetical protein ILO36_06865 [Abditibacteriota bacterium]|nr:hypothetical protein [Abditibacteriota bacterium]